MAADHGPAPVAQLGAAEAEKLRSLGYLTSPQPKRAGRLPDPKAMMEVHRLLGEAQDALQRGESQAAVSKLEAVVARDPENVTALETQGAALARVGRLAQAEETFARALALDPGRISLLLAAAELRAQSGRLDQALQLATLAAERDPRSAEARVAMARFQQALGRGEAAAESARAAFALAPHAAMVEIAYADLVERPAGQLDQARQRLLDVVEREPLLPEGWVALGTLAEKRNDVEGAIAAYERGLKRQPAAGKLHAALGVLLAQEGRPGSEQHLRRAAELLQPTAFERAPRPGAAGDAGAGLEERGALGSGRDRGERRRPSAWTLLAASLEEQSRPDDAHERLRRSAPRRPAAPAGAVQPGVAAAPDEALCRERRSARGGAGARRRTRSRRTSSSAFSTAVRSPTPRRRAAISSSRWPEDIRTGPRSSVCSPNCLRRERNPGSRAVRRSSSLRRAVTLGAP